MPSLLIATSWSAQMGKERAKRQHGSIKTPPETEIQHISVPLKEGTGVG